MALSEQQWLAAFDATPDPVLDRLLCGYDQPDGFGPYAAKDIAGFLFTAEPPGSPRLTALDGALCRWLAARLAADLQTMRRPALLAAELTQGLGLAQRLPLPRCAALLAERHAEFDALTWMLSVDGRDPRFDFWRALAATQPRRSFLGRWLDLCDAVGKGQRDERWLDVALLGLRRLPHAADSSDLDPALLTGLARWGRHLDAAGQDRFLSRWRDLRAAYPRTPKDWQVVVAPVLAAHPGRPFTRWWADDLGLAAAEGQARPGKPERGVDFLNRVKPLAGADLAAAVAAFRAAHEQEVADGGDRHDLAISFDVAGRPLLKRAPLLALSLAISAVEHEPEEQRRWDLLAESLAECGQLGEAEAVLWHARARFGDNAYVRTQLAKHLGRVGRGSEAEALYRETLRLDPANSIATGALAHLLAQHGRAAEAETLLRAAIAADPTHTDAVFRTDLALLLVGLGRWDEAAALYRDTMDHFPRDAPCRRAYGIELVWRGDADAAGEILAELKALRTSEADALSRHIARKAAGKTRPTPPVWRPPPVLPLPDAYVAQDQGWQAVRAGFRLALSPGLLLCTAEEREALRREAEETLDRLAVSHRHHPLVRLIALRRGRAAGGPLPAGMRHSLPLAVQAARGDGARLALLAAGAEAGRPLAWLGLLEAGADRDGTALAALLRWLAGPAPAETSPLAYLHRRMGGLSGMDVAIRRQLPSASLKAVFGAMVAQMEELAPDLLDIALMRMAEEELSAGMDLALAA